MTTYKCPHCGYLIKDNQEDDETVIAFEKLLKSFADNKELEFIGCIECDACEEVFKMKGNENKADIINLKKQRK